MGLGPWDHGTMGDRAHGTMGPGPWGHGTPRTTGGGDFFQTPTPLKRPRDQTGKTMRVLEGPMQNAFIFTTKSMAQMPKVEKTRMFLRVPGIL